MSRVPTAVTSGSAVPAGCEAKCAEYEVEPRVRRIEQQLQETLPSNWREFAGRPFQISYYDKKINTFRENEDLAPSAVYTRWAVAELRKKLDEEHQSLFTELELREIVRQEWRTDMARSVWEVRLNRHGSKDGPVVRRSQNGVIRVTSQPTTADPFVIDAIAQPPTKAKRKATVTVKSA